MEEKHAEFGFPVTKFIASDAWGSHNRFVEHISPHSDHTSNRRLCPFCVVEIFLNMLKNFAKDERDITDKEQVNSMNKKQT